MIKRLTAAQALIACTALILVGCGGSSSQDAISVSLGGAIQLKEGRSVQVAATVQNEQPGFQYRWQQVSGPVLQLSSTSTRQIQVTAPAVTADGVAVLSLTVSDAAGNKATDSMQITLKDNRLPLVSVNEVQLQEKSSAVLRVNAQDPDGTVTHIDWIQTAGPVLAYAPSSAAELAVTVPAIGKVEHAVFQISVTDDDGEIQTVEHSFQLEPLWQEIAVGGTLVAKEMAGAEITARVNNELFHTTADANGAYSLTLKLDDDAQNDFVLMRAVSASKAGMELWLGIPSLQNKPSSAPASITPYSTSILALAARMNNGVVPDNSESMRQAEMQISSAEAAEAAIMLAAFAEQNTVHLPAGSSSVFQVVANSDSFALFKDELTTKVPVLLWTLAEKLPLQGAGKLDLTEHRLMQGLRLQSQMSEGSSGEAMRYYHFNADTRAGVADEQFGYAGSWNMLLGSVLTHATTTQMPLYQLSVDNPDLGLTDEQLQAMKAENISTLDVKVTSLVEQLSQVSRGVSRDLFLRSHRIGYQVQPVQLNGELLEFLPLEVETEEYVWGSVLYSSTLALNEQMIVGQATMPVYRSSMQLEQSKFQLQDLMFERHGEGYSLTTGETFSWSVGMYHGAMAMQLDFNTGFRQVMRINVQMTAGYLADILVYDNNGQWLAAQAGSIYRPVGI